MLNIVCVLTTPPLSLFKNNKSEVLDFSNFPRHNCLFVWVIKPNLFSLIDYSLTLIDNKLIFSFSTKNKFGDERFHYFMFQVCFQCIVNCIVARTGMLHYIIRYCHLNCLFSLIVAWYKGETLTIKPYSLFGTLTLTYVGAMVSSNAALAFISYPTQVCEIEE